MLSKCVLTIMQADRVEEEREGKIRIEETH